MIERQVREALAIEADAGGLQAADQFSIGQPVLAGGGIDAHDPQPAEVPLLAAAAGVGVIQRLVDRLLGCLVQLALGGVEPLRALQQLLALGAPDGSSFYAGHLLLLKTRLNFEVRTSKFEVNRTASSGAACARRTWKS